MLREDEPFERSVFRVTEKANFCCQWCGQGAQTFEEAFPNGCVQCGAPAGIYDKETVVREFPDLEKRFFIVYGNDTASEVEGFIKGLEKKGVGVVTLADILPNGVATNEVSRILQHVVREVPWVLFVPSPQMKESVQDDFILEMVMNDMLRYGTRKTFPVYVDRDYIQYAPHTLSSIWGVMLHGPSGDGAGGTALPYFFDKQLPNLTGIYN